MKSNLTRKSEGNRRKWPEAGIAMKYNINGNKNNKAYFWKEDKTWKISVSTF